MRAFASRLVGLLERRKMKKSIQSVVTSVFLIVFSALVLLPGPAAGQDSGNLFHWAYAPAFGTGAYRIAGDETFVITFKPKIDLRKQVEDRIGIKLTLPLSFGLQTLDIDELISPDLPDQLTTVSFVPGVEFLVPIGQRWMVKPFGNIGWGTSFNSNESAWIYFGGAKSRYRFEVAKNEWGFLSELLWAGYTPSPGSQDDFSRFMLGLEADFPVGNVKLRKQQLLFRPHFLYYKYFNDLDFVEVSTGSLISLDEEVEIALAFGTKEPQKLWIFQPDRFGLGVRLSEDLKGIRIFFRSVFD